MEKPLLILSIIFAFGLILGLFIGVIMVSENFLSPGISKTAIAQNIKDLYELATGMSIEKVDVTREGWLYKAKIYIIGMDVTEIYATLDGKFISENIFVVKEYKNLLEKQEDFQKA